MLHMNRREYPLDAPAYQVFSMHPDKDDAFWNEFYSLMSRHPHSHRHILSHWPAYVRSSSLVRFLGHYELFKSQLELPGDIVELGVSRGISFFTFHKLMEIFSATDVYKKIYGFDSFEGLTDINEKDSRTAGHGSWSAKDVEDEIFGLQKLFNFDNVVSPERSRIIKGRIQDTLPKFVQESAGIRISLLHFDLDLYEPTKFALEQLWDLIVPNGIIVFDEYANSYWQGETKAFDEFCAERNIKVELKRFSWCPAPSAFCVKPS